jgi:signal transduction histidine kinase
MKKLLMMLALMALATFAHAETRGSKTEAEAMVKKAIAHMKAKGIAKTVEEVNARNGVFNNGDLYITIYDMNMKNLAHGANARMVGKDMIELKDMDGKYYMRERLQIITEKGKGWQDFKFVNPVSKEIEPKSMYVERFGDFIFGCGAYKPNS